MFISAGENIFPEEIERTLSNIESIAQVIVVPVDAPALGQRPVAFIKIKDGKSINSDYLEAALRENIEGFKVPVAFLPWPDIEDSSIKPDRKAFRDYAASLKLT